MIGDELDLYDREAEEAIRILGKLQIKYGKRPGTFATLTSFQSEAMDLFEKAGFIATVSVYDENGKPRIDLRTGMISPEITIHGRSNPTEFDPERQQFEVKRTDEDTAAMIDKLVAQGGTSDQRAKIQGGVEITDKEYQEED